MALWKFSAREVRSRPGRVILTVLSIALGVAAVVSVNIATQSARGAYKQLYKSMAGRASLEIGVDGGGDFDAGPLGLVSKVPGVKAALPIIQRPTILYHEGERVKLFVLGADLDNPESLQDYTLKQGRIPSGNDGALISEAFANSLELKVDDVIKLLTRNGPKKATVFGLLAPRGARGVTQGGVVFLPLKRAQTLFAEKGRVDSIQIILEDHADESAVNEEIAANLPTGVSVRRPAARSQMADDVMLASEQALRWASAMSLLVAFFIILNTFLMNVAERRRHLAILRAIGATRKQIVRLLLWEGFLTGVAGSVLGMLIGLGGARLLAGVMERLFQVDLPSMEITPQPFIRGTLFGLVVSLLSTYIPARKAGRLTPLEGMSSVSIEDVEGLPRWIPRAGAVVMTVSGSLLVLCMLGWLPVEASSWFGLFTLTGLILLLPAFLAPVARLISAALDPLLGIEGVLASRQLLRRRMRTTLTVGVLFVAITVGIGMASTLMDNIRDVDQWYQKTVSGDFFVRAMMPDMATGLAADMPPGIGDELRKVPGITNIETARFVSARASGTPVLVIVRQFSEKGVLHFDLRSGDPDTLRERLFGGDVVIGTVLAQRKNLHVDDEIELETREGKRSLTVAAIANEYSVGGMALYMERAAAAKLFNIQGENAFGIKAAPERRGEVEAALRELCRPHGLLLQSFTDLRHMIDGMISGVVASVWVLLALEFIVASFGVVNTLNINVLEQTREIGMLRTVAMTRGQIRKTILAQAGIIGIIGVIPGLITGVAMAYLINLTMLPVIGRAIQFVFHPLLLAASLVGCLLIVLAAAWFPARRAARLPLMESLRYE